jgi:hypothetical protein
MARPDGEWWLDGVPVESEREAPTPERYRVLDSLLALSVFIACVALAAGAFVHVPRAVWLVLVLLVAVTFTGRAVARRSLR